MDGLRALSALAVILFHARVPGFSGGFVGVDVFFVLPGYPISRILEGGIAAQSFYRRGAARLRPGLLLMVAAYLLVFAIICRCRLACVGSNPSLIPHRPIRLPSCLK